MRPLLETIKVCNREILNINYHNERVNRSRFELVGVRNKWDIGKFIPIPKRLLENVIYKCRFIYYSEVISLEFIPYTIHKIETLGLVISNDLEYNHKFSDREKFEQLKQSRPGTDDIIIVKDKQITDCSFANLVFFDGTKWITPKNPLLKGTKRQKYLEEKVISEQIIAPEDLKQFSRLRLINAMIDLEESYDIPIKNILL
jgi:4-amino-4-deoxychorismate lyase